MTAENLLASLWVITLWLVHIGFMARAVLRRHREPTSRLAWVVVIAVLPLFGIVAYLLLGETNIGRNRATAMRRVLAQLPTPQSLCAAAEAARACAEIPENYRHLFMVGKSINGFSAVGGNRAQLMRDSNATIDAIVADIDGAREHVHLMFYIWLADNNGIKVIEALKRAAQRGVTCRAMADGLGSRRLIASEHWRELADAGVRVAVALPIGNPLVRVLRGRIDLRNHRKIVVIDNWITYCGSQNCADPEFRVKAKYAPWVDAMIRFAGPIARQNQHLFASDWLAHVAADRPQLNGLLCAPLLPLSPAPGDADRGSVSAQVIGTGPTIRNSAMPEMFETLIFAARREIFITTPYYVPDESMQSALCAAALRGVAVTLIFPARNDSRIVGLASRSYYPDLLAAGVRIFEYEGGLLHTKSLTVDGDVGLIGSANMDRRSFDLNYENNILFYDPTLTAALRARQNAYLASSRAVDAYAVGQWHLSRRLLNNATAMFGPVL
jgi:cardiolipin synthase